MDRYEARNRLDGGLHPGVNNAFSPPPHGDGRPEVFTRVHGSCLGSMAGVHMNLYAKDRHSRWRPQFGFPGVYVVLKTRNKGYPDIEIGGPGNCFPVWRWNGRQYALYKKCN